MPSPEEPAAAAGLRPINCSPSSPFSLQHGEFTKFSESSKSLTKAAEPEGPWTPQPRKNAVREGETERAGDEGEEREEAGRQMVQFFPGFLSFRFKPVQAVDTRLRTQCRVILLVWVEGK